MQISLPSTQPLTKTQIKKLRRKNIGIGQELKPASIIQLQGLKLKNIRPKTLNQAIIFKKYQENNLLIHGYAGTGKTFLGLYLALYDVLENMKYSRVIIVRSAVATRDIGFLPGNKSEKVYEYELPYQNICFELFGRPEAYATLKNRVHIEFIPTSFIRGLTFNDAVIIVDETQNMSLHELDSIITRVGENCKIVMCGDFRQSDLKFHSERQGLIDFMKIIKELVSFYSIEMMQGDIVRSPLIKEYLIKKTELGYG